MPATIPAPGLPDSDTPVVRPAPLPAAPLPAIGRQLAFLVFALVCMAILAGWPQVQELWDGHHPEYLQGGIAAGAGFGGRLLREGTLLILVLYLALQPGFWSTLLDRSLLLILAFFGTYISLEFLYALSLGLPPIVPISGLRIFQYLPLGVLGIMLARASWGQATLDRLASWMRLFVLIQGALALYQVVFAPPVNGYSPFGGGRAFGTFVSPNLFGVSMASCALVFALASTPRLRNWAWATTLLAVLSGSRTGMLAAFLVLGFLAYYAFVQRERWMLVYAAPLLGVAGLVLASTQLLSGRVIQGEGRLDHWIGVLQSGIDSWTDLLFGWGLGLGSNTVTVLYGVDAFPGQYISDSLYVFMLGSYGLIFVLAYLALLLGTWLYTTHEKRGLVVVFTALAGVPFNCWEYFPQNALLALSWGFVAGFRPAEHRYAWARHAGGPGSARQHHLPA